MTAFDRNMIGVFSHGGTRNLGDEARLAAVIQNVRLHIPNAEIFGFTINPQDTIQRHGITSYPIRRSTISPAQLPAPSVATSTETAAPKAKTAQTIKNMLKSVPGLRPLLAGLRRFTAAVVSILAEPAFLFTSYRRLKNIQLLLVAGSQQLNDGYGGAWGFPYPLFKWTLLATLTGTKAAILSVGA